MYYFVELLFKGLEINTNSYNFKDTNYIYDIIKRNRKCEVIRLRKRCF